MFDRNGITVFLFPFSLNIIGRFGIQAFYSQITLPLFSTDTIFSLRQASSLIIDSKILEHPPSVLFSVIFLIASKDTSDFAKAWAYEMRVDAVELLLGVDVLGPLDDELARVVIKI